MVQLDGLNTWTLAAWLNKIRDYGHFKYALA
jgi:hypothetical protein